jgi:hypothetical protein
VCLLIDGWIVQVRILAFAVIGVGLVSSVAFAQAEDDLEIEASSSDDLEIEAAPSDDLEVEAAPSSSSSTPPATSTPAASPTPPATSTAPATSPDLAAELEALRARITELEARADAAPTPSPSPSPTHDLASDILRGLHVSAYLQAQYEWSQLSQNEIGPDGNLLNRDRFDIRRGRIRLRGQWDAFSLDLEVDGSTTRGPFFGLRRATVGLAYANPENETTPYVAGLVGLTDIPFGHELRLGQRDMPFMERTTGSLAFFRGPIDVGARMNGGLGPFRYDLAVMTGTPIDDRAGASGVDPTAEPDVMGRLGADAHPIDALTIAGGVSFLWGTGFSVGTPAQKSRVEWRDLNENGTLDTGELAVIPGRAALASATFQHWAVGADLELGLDTPLGRTDLFGEFVLASNLDRGLFVADPIATGADVREVSAYAAVVQSILGWGVIGFRYDYYDPNSDFTTQRRGLSVPTNASMHTFSPMVGVTLPPELVPGFRARLVVQYDAVIDHLGRDARGVPADLPNDQLTVRVQGELR